MKYIDSHRSLKTMESMLEKTKDLYARLPPAADHSLRNSLEGLTSSDGLLDCDFTKLKESRKSLENSMDSDKLLDQDFIRLNHGSPFWRRHARAFCIHISIFSLYFITVIFYAASNATLRTKLLRTSLYSPANEAVEWSVAPWPAGDGLSEQFVGYPRPELERAWKGLLGNMNIRISRENVEHFGREENAVALPDGSGYIGTLNVYHEIHCIRWLHKHLYQEIYWPDLDDSQREKNRVHSEHCLSTLRKFALCHGDVGLITYSWNPHSAKPSANATAHQCIDWEALAKWSDARAVDMFTPGYLVHPTLGPAYPDGEPMHGGPHEEVHTLPPIPKDQGEHG